MVAFHIVHWIKAFLFLLRFPLFFFPLIFFVYGQPHVLELQSSLHYAQLFTQKLCWTTTSYNVACIVPNSPYNASRACFAILAFKFTSFEYRSNLFVFSPSIYLIWHTFMSNESYDAISTIAFKFTSICSLTCPYAWPPIMGMPLGLMYNYCTLLSVLGLWLV